MTSFIHTCMHHIHINFLFIVLDYGGFGWFSDENGLEVGSACEGNFGPRFDLGKNNSNIQVNGKKFLVQSLWKRGLGCTMQL